MKKKSIINNEGITLIALVVSIVVMLILSAISLNATIGQNGIINQARKSKLKEEEAQVETDVSSALSALDIEYYQKVSSDSGISITSIYNIAGLSKYLKGKVNGFNYNKDGVTTIFYTTEKGSYTIKISQGQTTTYTGIRLERDSITNIKLSVGEKVTLSFDENTEIIWKTEKSDILQVDSKTGEVTRISSGTATINGYVKEDDGTEKIITTVIIKDENNEIAKDENTENSTSEMNIGASGENVKAYFMPREDGGKTLIIKGNGALAKTIDFTEDDKNSIKEIIFSDGITKITKNFNNLPNLEEVTIPKSVTSISGKAFGDNPKLTTLNYDAQKCSFNYIEEKDYETEKDVLKYAFSDSKISKVNIGENVESIPNYFLQKQELTSLLIPSNVREIGKSAFSNNSNLTELNFEDGIKIINDYAFSYCDIKNLIIPKTVETFGRFVFNNNENMNSLTLNTIAYTSPATIFSYCRIKKIKYIVNSYKIPDYFLYNALDNENDVENIEIPEGITTIGKYAFANCMTVTKVKLPSTLTEIGDSAFWDCKKLNNIKFPEELKKIDDDAFISCKNLVDIKFPNSLESIGMKSFAGTGITEITIPENLKNIGSAAFVNCPNFKIVYYNAIDASQSTFTYTYHGSTVCGFPFGGERENYQVENIIIGDKVKVLPGCLFRKTAITTVTIPTNVEKIVRSEKNEDEVFCNCVNLQEIIIEKPEGTFNRADLTNLSNVKITYKQ